MATAKMTNATGIERANCRLAQITWCWCKDKWNGGNPSNLDILKLQLLKVGFENGFMTDDQRQIAEYLLNCLTNKPYCKNV